MLLGFDLSLDLEDAMNLASILRSETTAWILGFAAIAAAVAVAYWLVGWLGIGLLGLIGLIVSNQVDLQGGHAVIDSGHGSSAVTGYARQLDQARASSSSPEQKMAAAAEREKRSKTVFLVNTAFTALTALGFGLFALHDLP